LEQNERLHHLLLRLKRMQFGTKSERLPEEQLQLGLEAIEQAIAPAAGPRVDGTRLRHRSAQVPEEYSEWPCAQALGAMRDQTRHSVWSDARR
jgi:hypothetical protein